MSFRSFVTYVLILGASSGCAFKSGPEAPAAVPLTTLEKAGSEGPVAWEVIATPEPHRYRVQWKLPEAFATQTLRLRRESGAGEFQELPVEADASGTVVDETVKDAEVYRYELISITDASPGPVSLARWTVGIPRDEVVAGVRTVASLPPKIGRLFLEPGSVLRTDGQNLTLEFEEIYSNEGLIESWAPEATAAPGVGGRSGGNLVLKIRRGSGRLHVLFRGERGGQGGTGVMGVAGAPGERGTAGIMHPWGFPSCVPQPGAGQPGGNGGVGGRGGRGLPGGGSGHVEVQMTESSPIDIQPELVGGAGGAGGQGGPGGPGGRGGAGGAVFAEHSEQEILPEWVPIRASACKLAPAGRDGDSGAQGPQGETGEVGPVDSYCVRNGSQTFGHCPSN